MHPGSPWVSESAEERWRPHGRGRWIADREGSEGPGGAPLEERGDRAPGRSRRRPCPLSWVTETAGVAAPGAHSGSSPPSSKHTCTHTRVHEGATSGRPRTSVLWTRGVLSLCGRALWPVNPGGDSRDTPAHSYVVRPDCGRVLLPAGRLWPCGVHGQRERPPRPPSSDPRPSRPRERPARCCRDRRCVFQV